MTIRAKIRASSIATVVLVMVFSGAMLVLGSSLRTSYEKQQFSQKITETSFQMSLLRSEYFIHPSERPKTQWINTYEALSRILDEAAPLFSKTEEEVLFDDMRKVTEDSRVLFGQLILSIEQGGNETVREELINQITVKAQTRVSNALHLSELSQRDVESALRLFEIILIILGMLFAAIYIASYFITTAIVASLQALGEDFMKISALDFSTTTTTTTTTTGSTDELNVLRRAFNSMADKLRESHTFLEQRVAERTSKLLKKQKEVEQSQKALLNILDDLKIEEQKSKKGTLALAEAQEIAQVGSWEWDMVKDVVSWSDELYRLFGLPPQEMKLTVESYVQLLYPDDRKLAQEVIGKALKTHEPFEFDHRVKLPNDEIRWIHGKGKVIVDANGTPILMTGTAQDITKEKAVDKAKTEFVSLASHQLRTPLTTISWYTEMLLQGDVGKVTLKQKKYLEQIYHGDKRMIELVDTLLDVSRIELGKFKIESKQVAVRRLIKSVVEEQKLQIKAKGLELHEHYHDELAILNTDPKILRMIVGNLLSNAVQYTPPKGHIEISVSQKEPQTLLLQVMDTGYGIPKDQQSQIFTKLFRADNVREKDTDGTGLGLYIVKSLVENCGGEVWFESEENKGSTFCVSLPLDGATVPA